MLFWMVLSAAVGPTDSKPMAMDDWQQLTILQVAAEDSPDATQHVRVAAGDLDGDGVADEAILAFDCRGGAATNTRYSIAQREQASGASSGKMGQKQKMWVPANFRLQQVRPTYDIKTLKGNERKVGVRGWDPEKKEEVDAGSVAAQTARDKEKPNVSYDVKKVEGTGARAMATDDWQAITLGATGGLCPAAADAARKATKTRSNIQNN